MQVTAFSFARTMVFATAMASVILSAAPAAAGDNAAHNLADKFSRAAQDAERTKAAEKAKAEHARAAERALQDRRKAEARRKAYEEDMLARARADAAARRAKEKRLAEQRAHAEAQRKAEAARLAKEAAEKRRAAKAARVAKEAEAKRLAEEARKLEAARLAKEAEEARKAAENRAALEALRAEQARRIVRKFRRAREQRMRKAQERKSLGGPRPPVADLPDPWWLQKRDLRPPLAELDETWPDEDDDFITTKYPARVTVLLVMNPRRHGWRRYKKAVNPVLCVGKRCYVSAGVADTADALPRRRALGPRNSLSRRAGPCNNQLVCVFRGVTLDRNPSYIQPIDMGLLRHRRRDIRKAEPDRTCAVTHGALQCASVIIAHRYRAWIVPEAVAEEAGPEALKEALYKGLTTTRPARMVSGRAP